MSKEQWSKAYNDLSKKAKAHNVNITKVQQYFTKKFRKPKT